ncbi:MAG: deoxyribodipyrimidine photo-lyase [Phycisphaerales bacterium]|nr:deoxyribodipyrimidine photo-lyase [Phycisphaerales bacterium]
MRSLVWLRSDLRTRDNTALHHAAKASPDGVVAAFIVSPEEWRAHDMAAVRVDFILRTLRRLSDDLHALHIPLLIAHAPRRADVPGLVLDLALRHGCAEVRCNIEYEVNESRRDERVRALLESRGVGYVAHHDQTIVPPAEVRTGEGRFYTVFTPFRRAWLRVLDELGGARALPAPRSQRPVGIARSPVPERVDGFDSSVDPALWPAGESAAMQSLRRFCQSRIEGYNEHRDFPAEPGTSRTSPYLAVGSISARQCLIAALAANDGRADGGERGPECWISELIWREFYRHILVGYPRVSMGRAFKAETERIPWSYDEEQFRRWTEGRTGFPIVDAAMRQLLQTGWMHNRLRMIAAMFLTKDLLIDWRWGERHFMRHLIDGDLAQNNGGWQWSASTGTDAAPYFRIFNPFSQSRKFDPTGAFIRRYVPELADLSDEDIHEPSALPGLLRAGIDYPEPMVDHALARDRAVAAFQALASRSGTGA